MGNAVSSFEFAIDTQSHNVRVVDIDGAPWFVAADVCRALDLRPGRRGEYTRHLVKLAADERTPIPPNQIGGIHHPISIISESGLYKLIMRSDKPQARSFQDWVTRTVLPAIRKDGAYIKGEEKVASGELSDDEFVLRAITLLQTKVERLTAERDALAAQSAFMTLDQYRAASRASWHWSYRRALAAAACKLARERGIKLEKHTREYTRDGQKLTGAVNIYPRGLLDEARHKVGEPAQFAA
ncbi:MULTISPECIES: Bro-N domain-containing protein [unclassified Chelatococcus]|uniref:BRO-N domain-containing protein n=1 Tax=unclassified Chelatococcus TaxID=2638111 RepID=UPI001BCB4AD1|nr:MULTISPECIES: Bro-N domain-containing protein [unclassified Chelatococcus]CAH1665546.1 Bro-N domain-containing protein [Hyphomicrobiales bacterium]MBS7737735.1 Bro-N domain-containing protein [Chelatococcus sp. HY11]MBX3547224.1 Bro-N domain-containing protein [Chelatococcus sp.]MCO5077137.1 Bro-N domain-containing protein [Chelatococcus sp.]CAH1681265.1 Bro-N domain-containing protein [Hyphomicrobiales bacterium]